MTGSRNRNSVNVGHPQKFYPVCASATDESPGNTPASYGIIDSSSTPFNGYSSMFFSPHSIPRMLSWDGKWVDGKAVCFIQEKGGNVRFVLNPEITGPSGLCTAGTYTIGDVPPAATIEWMVPYMAGPSERIYPLFIRSGQGTPEVECTRGGRIDLLTNDTTHGWTGQGSLQVIVRHGDDMMSMGKQVNVQTTATPVFELRAAHGGLILNMAIPQFFVVAGNTYALVCTNFPSDDDLEWTLIDNLGTRTARGSTHFFVPSAAGRLVVTLRNPDACPGAILATRTYDIIDYISLDFANPSTGTVDVRVSHGVPASSSSLMQATSVVDARPSVEQQPYTGAYTLELWDMFRGLVRTVDGSGGLTPFPLHGISPGNYILRLLVDGRQVDSKPLMVR